MTEAFPLACLLALWIDWRCGEPATAWHPVVWMGRLLGWFSPRIAPRATAGALHGERGQAAAFCKGAAAWLLLAALAVAAAMLLQRAIVTLLPWWWAQSALLALLLKPLLAWRMLRDEVLAVATALDRSLHDGRQQLTRLVSRDVAQLDGDMVAESAVESLAENLNDSVVAPLFWFCLLGLPGAALYRFANTADAMWGYPDERGGHHWQWAGKWAARADDALSWLPARLTTLLLLIASHQTAWRIWRKVPEQARKTPSPNGGWPMAAMALLLGLQLRKPGVYALNPEGAHAKAADIARAGKLATRAIGMLGALLAMATMAAIAGTMS